MAPDSRPHGFNSLELTVNIFIIVVIIIVITELVIHGAATGVGYNRTGPPSRTRHCRVILYAARAASPATQRRMRDLRGKLFVLDEDSVLHLRGGGEIGFVSEVSFEHESGDEFLTEHSLKWRTLGMIGFFLKNNNCSN